MEICAGDDGGFDIFIHTGAMH